MKNTVTKDQIDRILDGSTIQVETIGLKTTLVVVTLANGFEILQSSSCVDASNYDEEMGKSICMKKIEDKLWELEGYKLQCELAAKSKVNVDGSWKQYKRKGLSEMRPFVEGEDVSSISISEPDKANGSPKAGDMIARNPKNYEDQWLVAEVYFNDNLEIA